MLVFLIGVVALIYCAVGWWLKAKQTRREQQPTDNNPGNADAHQDLANSPLRAGRENCICTTCGAANPPSASRCSQCERLLPTDTLREALHQFLNEKSDRSRFVEFIAGAAIVLVLVRVSMSLSVDKQGAILMSTIVVGAILLLRSLNGTRG